MAHTNDGLPETSTQTPVQPKRLRHSLFSIVATVLGVNLSSSASHSYHPYGEPQPPQTSGELMATRFPYDYYQSLSG